MSHSELIEIWAVACLKLTLLTIALWWITKIIDEKWIDLTSDRDMHERIEDEFKNY